MQLQNKIQELETQLKQFKRQLNSYEKSPSILEATVGDTLEDGSIVLKKENDLALLIAPKSTEVECSWSPEFPEVFMALKDEGFNPSQWFVPSLRQLQLAQKLISNDFSPTYYWSSTEEINCGAWCTSFKTENIFSSNKSLIHLTRAFRCVTY